MVEVKSADDDAWLTAEGNQVSRYWDRYGLVLVTNTRDFVLLGEDAAGLPAKLETFRLAESAEEFEATPGDAPVLRPRHWRRPGRVPRSGAGPPRGPVRAERPRLAAGVVRP